MAINSIEYAKYTGNGAVALHAEGLSDLQSYIAMASNQAVEGDATSSEDIEVRIAAAVNAAARDKDDVITPEIASEISRKMLPQVRAALESRGIEGRHDFLVARVIKTMAASLER